MEKYTDKEIAKLVSMNEDINFIGAAITPWHALGISATICQLQQKGIEVIGYILIEAHSSTGVAVSEKDFRLPENSRIKIFQIEHTRARGLKEKISKKILQYKYYVGKTRENEKDRPLYWAVPMKPSYELMPQISPVMKNRKIQVILTDEGLATYLYTTPMWWKFAFIEGGIKSGLSATWTLLFRDRMFLHCLKKREQISYNQLLVGKKGKWEKNTSCIEAYRKILAQDKMEQDFSYYEGSIILNTDLQYETGNMTGSYDVPVYQEICRYAESRSLSVVMKNHPREKKVDRYQKLGCIRDQNGGNAQETILASLVRKPYCIVGALSTTLVTASILFGIDAISINYLIGAEHMKDTHFFNNFNKTFANLIYIPRNMEELKKDLDEIGSNLLKDR